MALITLNCAWLTWPRLASRQAGPKSRKISATSRAGRCTVRPATAVCPGVVDLACFDASTDVLVLRLAKSAQTAQRGDGRLAHRGAPGLEVEVLLTSLSSSQGTSDSVN